MLKRLSITLAILAVISGCSSNSEEPEEQQDETSSNHQESPADNQEVKEEITAPKEMLQKKDQGEKVTSLQNALRKIGYNLSEEGVYEEATTWAITDLQLQFEELQASGVYNKATQKVLSALLDGSEANFQPGKALPEKAETTTTTNGTPVLSNPYDQLAIVNKEFALPADYLPEDLVTPNVRFPFTEELPKKQMRQIAAEKLEDLFAAADEAGLDLYAQSGFRSYDRQDAIFTSNVAEHGEEAANNFSARPGESEHQSGLAMDVTSPDVNFQLIIEFGETDEGKWLKENAAEFGFIIRFPEGKEEITQYQFEPWHIRYVGEKAAKEIMAQGITLEEYYEE
ncbi:D-alanyl-D-alanine carboxypeptidase [Oceanobacillus picturae]|uniref:D-alanyl-D-alanine carboxypeptidase n=1 Tax=Oceanobacillus picturae TaxID=171693 RepID=W9AE52_9BACI|nr:D-alanyl-D-alanine carboxypeptidase family protein [Oceanobacillus picturae]RIU91883.1 carboxypeptidase [Oceanobacillus picturae]GAQ16580.1 D-alanyl-D-alanine carboxypeptidase [Oceanobacillus picturae]CDO04004.1 D-alanyl-D-alanine carboxypeptidase [Oceanobacillus picturae]